MRSIDSHHHLWRYDPDEYPWLTGDLSALQRDFLAPDLTATLSAAGVQAAVAVQARQTVQETRWLLQTAAETEAIVGVVGWLPLRASDLPARLDEFARDPLLRGLRHVVQTEPAGFMDDAAFRRGLAHVAAAGLTYDLLILENQLEEATRLVDACPNVSFVLDHIAKPRIGSGDPADWATGIAELARRPNTVCKVSGMVTEAPNGEWSAGSLRPYFDAVLEAFTPQRLLFGSDWPVVLARCSYSEWLRIVRSWTENLTSAEQAAIFGDNARRVYRLSESGAGNAEGADA